MFIEGAIVFAYCCLLTLHYGSWEGIGGYINMTSAWIFLIVLLALPPFILYFYLKNFDIMNSEDEEVAERFDEVYGAPLDGLKKDQKASVFYPVAYIIRRCLFAVMVVYLYKVAVVQIALQIVLTLITYFYLVLCVPFDDRTTQILEVFNEVMCLLILDILICFTPVISPDKRNDTEGYVGFTFILLIAFTIGVHIYSLL